MWFLFTTQCSIPQKLTFIDGVQLPFLSDCPQKSRGSLELRGTLRNGTVFRLVSSNLTVQPGSNSSEIYFEYDIITIISRGAYQFGIADVAFMDIYANATVGRKSRIIGIEWLNKCEYAAQMVDASLAEPLSKQYLIFPRGFDCYPYNFSQLEAQAFIKRLGSAQEDHVFDVSADAYHFLAGVKIDANDKVKANYIEYIRILIKIGQTTFSFQPEISRSPEEVAESLAHGVPAVARQFHNCIAAEVSAGINIIYNNTHAIFAVSDYRDCYLSLQPYVIAGSRGVLMKTVQSPYFYPHYVLDMTAGVSLAGLEIYEYYPFLTESTLTQSNKRMIHKLDGTVKMQQINGPCNESELGFYVEKPDFKALATVMRVYQKSADGTPVHADDYCVDMRAINVRLESHVAAATAVQFQDLDFENLPDVYIMKYAHGEPARFQFDDAWLRFELDSAIWLKFDLMRSVPFKTPHVIGNCLYSALRAFMSDGMLKLVSKQICSGKETKIDGFEFKEEENCKNMSSGNEFDMYLCVSYREISPQPKLKTKLTDFYLYEKNYTAADNDIEPYEYVTEEEHKELMAQLSQFETNNYDYMDWVVGKWWIFAALFAVGLLIFTWSIYGCQVPCKYIVRKLLFEKEEAITMPSFRVPV